MKKVVIIGAGAMGSAFSVPCADNSNEVFLVGSFLEDKVIDEIKNLNNFHPILKSQLPKNINVNDALIKLDFNNEFPWKCCANLKLMSGEILNSSPICINHCQVDNLGNLVQATNSINELDLENNLLIELQNDNRIILELVISSPDSTNYFPILGNYNLYYSVNLDVNSKINLN